MATSLETTEAWLQRLKRTSSGLRRTCQDIRIQVIKELGEKEHILALEIKRKLEQNQELSESERAYIERPTRGKHSDYKLSKTHHGCLNAAAISKLDGMFFMMLVNYGDANDTHQSIVTRLHSSCSELLPFLGTGPQMASQHKIYSCLALIS